LQVVRPISTENPEYLLQGNPHTRGKSQKPVVVLTNNGTTRVLECYSVLSDTPTVDKKLYIKAVAAEDNPVTIVPYIVLMCAIKIYGIIERADMVKVLTEDLMTMIKLQTL